MAERITTAKNGKIAEFILGYLSNIRILLHVANCIPINCGKQIILIILILPKVITILFYPKFCGIQVLQPLLLGWMVRYLNDGKTHLWYIYGCAAGICA